MTDKYTPIHNEVLEQICRINLSPYETRILFAIWRKTYGFVDKSGNRKKKDRISGSQFTAMTGLDRRLVCRALKGLEKKLVISRDDKYISFSKAFYSDLSSVEMTKNAKLSSILLPRVISRDDKLSSVAMHTKERKKLYKRKTTAEVKTSATFSFFTKVKNYYIEQFEKNFHTKPAISFGKDGAVVNRKRGLFATDKEWQLMVRWFLNSTKAEKCGNTLSVCFSTDTINRFKIQKAQEEAEFSPPPKPSALSPADQKIQDEFYKLPLAEQEKRKKENTGKLAEILKTAFKQ